jgi:hypothetical protein
VNLCAFSGFRVDRRDWERALRIRPVVQWGSAFDGSQVYVALADVAMLAPPPGGRGAQPTMLGIAATRSKSRRRTLRAESTKWRDRLENAASWLH